MASRMPGGGRPAIGPKISFRLRFVQLRQLEALAEANDSTKSETLRKLVRLGLEVTQRPELLAELDPGMRPGLAEFAKGMNR